MKKLITLIIVSSIIFWACNKEEIVNPKTSPTIEKSETTSVPVLIGNARLQYLASLNSCSFTELDLFFSTVDNSTLTYQQKTNILSSNINLNNGWQALNDVKNLYSNNTISTSDYGIIIDIILTDPIPTIQNVDCYSILKQNMVFCEKNYDDCVIAGNVEEACCDTWNDCADAMYDLYDACKNGGTTNGTGGLFPVLTSYFDQNQSN